MNIEPVLKDFLDTIATTQRKVISLESQVDKLLTENTMLKKQLEVAVKALHKISKCEADTLQGCNVEAKEALAEIKRIGGGE